MLSLNKHTIDLLQRIQLKKLMSEKQNIKKTVITPRMKSKSGPIKLLNKIKED